MTLHAQPFEVIFERRFRTRTSATVTVAITCFKYGNVCLEALDSLSEQTETPISVVVIDDHSPDDSVALILPWFQAQQDDGRFESLLFIRHCENQGLSRSRNTAITQVVTPYTFILDADNLIYPRALKTLREALEVSGAAMAYSLTSVFGGQADIIGNSIWLPEKFSSGNYIDAMAMIRTAVLIELGGYRVMPNKFGWEDFDFWCKMIDASLEGCHVPEILCRYRSHPNSMVNTDTRSFVQERLALIKEDFEKHHSMKFNF